MKLEQMKNVIENLKMPGRIHLLASLDACLSGYLPA
jgi:hypothetical protein